MQSGGMSAPPEPSCRLYAILARDGRSAVVFRRGPSKQVLLLRWWLDEDRFEEGQWFKGRIYEYRCDLSPDGELLIYFAAKWKGPHDTWTAVSRPPYLTALVMWPKGDAWGGGGVFNSATSIGLNHRSCDGGKAPGRQGTWHPLGPERRAPVPSRYSVALVSDWAGAGEDNPIHAHRIMRDGWTCIAEGDAGPYSSGSVAWDFRSPEIYERASPKGGLRLRRLLKAIHQRNGPWYVHDFEVVTSEGTSLRLIPDCSWADWSPNGDLLFAVNGSLYRLKAADAKAAAASPQEAGKQIVDLSNLTFQHRPAPDWATKWP